MHTRQDLRRWQAPRCAAQRLTDVTRSQKRVVDAKRLPERDGKNPSHHASSATQARSRLEAPGAEGLAIQGHLLSPAAKHLVPCDRTRDRARPPRAAALTPKRLPLTVTANPASTRKNSFSGTSLFF